MRDDGKYYSSDGTYIGPAFTNEVEELEAIYELFNVKNRNCQNDWNEIVRGETIEAKVSDRFYFQISANGFGVVQII